MESLRRFADGRRAMVFGRTPLRFHWVAGSDYARMVSRAYETPTAANKAFPIFGPEAYTIREALTRYCAIVHPNIRVRAFPFWIAWTIAVLGRHTDLRAALPILRYCEKVGEEEDPAEANALLGAPTTTLEEWSRSQLSSAAVASAVA
jgi:NADH dehydrogenase